MLPDRLSDPGPLTYESGALPIALRGPACLDIYTLVYPFFPLSPFLWETARYRLKYCLKGPLNPKRGKLPVPGRPTSLITVGQGPIALAVGAAGGNLDIFTLTIFSPLSPSLWETARYRLILVVLGLTAL